MNEDARTEFKSGWYRGNGRNWFCGKRRDSETIECNGEDGSYTAASIETFKKWGWKFQVHSVHELT